MGMHIVTQNTMLDLRSLGIKDTDMLYVFCVGAGGGGGGAGGGSNSSGGSGKTGHNGCDADPGDINAVFLGKSGIGFGAGAAGGSAPANNKIGATGGAGAGGGAGAVTFTQILMYQYEGSWTIPVTIGAGGKGGKGGTTNNRGASGTSGGTTSFGNILSAKGGNGGTGGYGGNTNSSAASVASQRGYYSGCGGGPYSNGKSSNPGGGGAGGFVPGSLYQFGGGASRTSEYSAGANVSESVFGGNFHYSTQTSYSFNVRTAIDPTFECLPGRGAVILFW